MLFLSGVIAVSVLLFFGLQEPFNVLLLIGIIVMGLILHVSGSVLFTGYAPTYLLFAIGHAITYNKSSESDAGKFCGASR